MQTDKINIGIAGAGIAGLVAGLELQHAGYSVSIFEARPRAGGRIHTIPLNGMMIETGPEFIHGNLKETIGLLKKYKIRYDPINGKMYGTSGGTLQESYDMGEGWDQLLVKMKSLKDDLPFHIFLEKYFRGDHFIKLRKSATRFAEGFDLADVKTASTMALMREWEHEESAQYRIREGYGTLISAMENEFKGEGGKIFLNHPIASIDWNSEKIILVLKNNNKFNIDKLMISLPLGILNHSAPSSESIVFLPAIKEKQKAFGQIGFGTVIKIIMIWDTAFWKDMVPDALFIFSDRFIPTWWTQFPLDLPILTGWLGGPKAEQVADKPDQFFRDKAIDSLASIFFVSTDEIKKGLRECIIFNWKNEPWSRGAYSYSLVGSGDAKAICRKSLQNRIYFSGEAYYEGPYPGTVEAAVVSGLQSARQMVSDMKS